MTAGADPAAARMRARRAPRRTAAGVPGSAHRDRWAVGSAAPRLAGATSLAAPRLNRCELAAAMQEITEGFVRSPIVRPGRKQGIEGVEETLLVDILAIKLVEPQTLAVASEMKVVAAGRLTNQAKLGEIRPRGALRAAPE